MNGQHPSAPMASTYQDRTATAPAFQAYDLASMALVQLAGKGNSPLPSKEEMSRHNRLSSQSWVHGDYDSTCMPDTYCQLIEALNIV